MRANLGLDQPIPVQYLKWAAAIGRGDFGRSYTDGRPVMELIGDRLPNTLLLSSAALLLALVLGLGAGIVAALKRGAVIDKAVMFVAVIGESVPIFWLAILAILLFAVQLRVLPSSGMATLGEE